MPFATNEEIRIAHDVLLKGKKPFDAPRAEIIKKNSSCYIQACPGSERQLHCWQSLSYLPIGCHCLMGKVFAF